MIQDSTENVKIIRISYLQVFPQERHVFSLSEQKNCQSWKSSWHKSSQETSERKLTLRTRKTCSNAQQRSDQVVCISCCRLKVYFELKMPRILSRSSVHRNDKRSSWAGSTSRPSFSSTSTRQDSSTFNSKFPCNSNAQFPIFPTGKGDNPYVPPAGKGTAANSSRFLLRDTRSRCHSQSALKRRPNDQRQQVQSRVLPNGPSVEKEDIWGQFVDVAESQAEVDRQSRFLSYISSR